MILIYPAIFYNDPESGAYAVEVPDLPGCVSGGSSFSEAKLMGIDAASGWILDELESGNEIPPASKEDEIHPEPGGKIELLFLDIQAYADKYGDNRFHGVYVQNAVL